MPKKIPLPGALSGRGMLNSRFIRLAPHECRVASSLARRGNSPPSVRAAGYVTSICRNRKLFGLSGRHGRASAARPWPSSAKRPLSRRDCSMPQRSMFISVGSSSMPKNDFHRPPFPPVTNQAEPAWPRRSEAAFLAHERPAHRLPNVPPAVRRPDFPVIARTMSRQGRECNFFRQVCAGNLTTLRSSSALRNLRRLVSHGRLCTSLSLSLRAAGTFVANCKCKIPSGS